MKLIPTLPLDDGKALPGYSADRYSGVRHLLAFEQMTQHLAGHAAHREDRKGIATQLVHGTGDIDPAAARVVARLSTTQFLGRHDSFR